MPGIRLHWRFRERAHFLPIYFWHAFVCGFTRRVLLVLILAVVGGVLFLNLGAAAGLPVLFWHESWWQQGLAGWSVAVLVFVVLYVGFLLDQKSSHCGQWRAALPADVRPDLIGQLKWYLHGGVLSVVFVGLLGLGVWGIGKVFQRVQGSFGHEAMIGSEKAIAAEQGPESSFAALLQDPAKIGGYFPFICGVLVAIAALEIAGRVMGPMLRSGRWRRRSHGTPVADEVVDAYLTDDERRASAEREAALLKRRLRIVSGLLFTFLMGNYVVNALGWGWATPATALCSALGLLAVVYGYLTYWEWNRTLFALGFVLLLMVGGIPQYKVQVPGLERYYDGAAQVGRYALASDAPRPRAGPATRPGDLIRMTDIEWSSKGGERRPLVLVCVSGGGIRASVWSAAVLCELERRIEGFPYAVRMVSGASGGMVGAGYYVSTLVPPGQLGGALGGRMRHALTAAAGHADALETLVRNLAKDSLSVSVKRMIFHDALWTVWPGTNRNDRGRALEAQWGEYWDTHLDRGATGGAAVGDMTFGRLWQGEREGWRPSLVYSPMLVEDGRRLLISNLDLTPLTLNVGARLAGDADDGVEAYGFYSRSGAQLKWMFPEAWVDFRVITAARLSASFPYVSPAAVLPTSPRRRVVDAGYYDNYGVTVAAAWLADALTDEDRTKIEWLKRHVSGVLVLQVRDGVNRLSELDTRIGATKSSPGGRGFEWASSPVEGVLSARESVSVFRNDAGLQKVAELFRIVGGREGLGADFFATATVEFEGSAPLSWYLTEAETGGMLSALKTETGKRPTTGAALELKGVEEWFGRRRSGTGAAQQSAK